MKPPVVSEAEAQKASRRLRVWKSGWYDGRTAEALEKLSKAGNDCFELSVIVRDAAGEERPLRDWLTATSFGLLKLKHCIESVGASGKYNAGEEISQDDFPGHDLQVKIGVEKKRGFPDRNIIEDYRAASSSSLVTLRTVAKAVAFVGGVSLAALSTACSTVPGPQTASVDPMRYKDYEQRYIDYAAPSRPSDAEIMRFWNSRLPSVAQSGPSWQHDLGKMADGAALGAVVGSTLANRAKSGVRTGPTQEMVDREVAEHAAEQRAKALAAEQAEKRTAERAAVGVVERGMVARAAPAAVGAAEGEAAFDRVIIWLGERWWLRALPLL